MTHREGFRLPLMLRAGLLMVRDALRAPHHEEKLTTAFGLFTEKE